MELGRHMLLEFVGADKERLNDEEVIRNMMVEAAEMIHATILHQHFHRFYPQGITGILAIAESHLSIHTWPEHAYAAVDIFTCGDTSKLESAATFIQHALKASKMHTASFQRGTAPIQMIMKKNVKSDL
ncbi:MAG: adenosylmethionine decarboxylase [Bacteroidia bacterium]|nr:adenosylmethionine decarboxylase [Bacteroidia bacterium]